MNNTSKRRQKLNFKPLRSFLTSSKGNSFLAVILIVLINLVGFNAFLRLDLSTDNVHSLSTVSKQLIRHLEEPLSIKVFFSANLPAPYNGVGRYLKDLMREYDSVDSPHFSYDLVDMDDPESRAVASSYGIYSIQIQEVKNDTFQARDAYMALAISYGDQVETLDNLTTTDLIEYRITTTAQKLISTVGALSSLTQPLTLSFYYSSVLSRYDINGFDTLTDTIRQVFEETNQDYGGLMSLEIHSVDDSQDAENLASQFGLHRIIYGEDSNTELTAVMEFVLEQGDRFKTLPLDVIGIPLFGGYEIVGLDNLRGRLDEAVTALVSDNPAIAYVTGHGERDLNDPNTGAAPFRDLNSDMYEFVEVNLQEEDIPTNVSTLVINGPKNTIPETELFKIDQFLMNGGSLFVLLDPYWEINPQQEGGGQPFYIPINTGMEDLMAHYGVTLEQNYVLDTESFVSRQDLTEFPLYFVPILQKENLDDQSPITKNLGGIVILKNAELKPSEDLPEGLDITVLASSSKKSWTIRDNIDLSPFLLSPPPEEEMDQYPLFALIEGNFESYYDQPPETSEDDDALFSTETLITESVLPGKIIIGGSSEITGSQLLDPEGRGSGSVFVHNMVDYLNGNADVPLLRSKGLNQNFLRETSELYRQFVKVFSIGGIPILVLLTGLIVWRVRESRRRSIELRFSAQDSENEDGE